MRLRVSSTVSAPAADGGPAADGEPAPDGEPAADLVPVRDASTVMLVRDAEGVEVFAFRRARRMAFAAGMLVFPGGSVDPQDRSDQLPWRRRPAGSELAAAGSELVAAAVRETFEECGVLLAVPDPGATSPGDGSAGVDAVAPDTDLVAVREALLDGRCTLADVLHRRGLALDADLLHPWARWVTPPGEVRRFDTRFYLARVPAGQEPLDLGGEGEGAAWLNARTALARHAAGELPMLPPTLVAIEELAAAESVEALFATRRAVSVVRPEVIDVQRADGSIERVLRIEVGDDGQAIGSAR